MCVQEQESKKRYIIYDNYNEILFAWGAHTLETDCVICNINFFLCIKSPIFNSNLRTFIYKFLENFHRFLHYTLFMHIFTIVLHFLAADYFPNFVIEFF